MSTEESNTIPILDRIAAVEAREREMEAEIGAAKRELQAELAAQEAAMAAKLAEIQAAKRRLSNGAAPPVTAPKVETAKTAPQPKGDAPETMTQGLRRSLREENLQVIVPALLAIKNDLTFSELWAEVTKVRTDFKQGSLHSALGRLRDRGQVKFIGERPHVSYHLLMDGEPSAATSDGGVTQENVHAILVAHPGMPIKEMAARLYGNESEMSTNRIRSHLAKLKTAERVRSIGRGAWEAIVSA